MVSLMNCRLSLKSFAVKKAQKLSNFADSQSVTVSRSHPPRRWRLKSTLEPSSSSPTFHWVKCRRS